MRYMRCMIINISLLLIIDNFDQNDVEVTLHIIFNFLVYLFVYCVQTQQLCSLSNKYQSLDVRYLDSLSSDVAKSRSRLRCGESMRVRSISLSTILVSENFPVMSFVGRFPSRTEKLNAKVLSDIQYLCAPGKRCLRTWLRTDCSRDYSSVSLFHDIFVINKIRVLRVKQALIMFYHIQHTL